MKSKSDEIFIPIQLDDFLGVLGHNVIQLPFQLSYLAL